MKSMWIVCGISLAISAMAVNIHADDTSDATGSVTTEAMRINPLLVDAVPTADEPTAAEATELEEAKALLLKADEILTTGEEEKLPEAKAFILRADELVADAGEVVVTDPTPQADAALFELAATPSASEAVPTMSEVKGDEATSAGLAGLIREAIKTNGELASARSDEEIHRGKSHYNRKDWFPKMALYHTYDSQPDSAGTDDNGNPKNSPVNQSERTWRKAYGMNAEQLLFDWGETRGKVHQESHTAESYAWKAKAKEAEIAYDVAEAYWRVVFFQDVVGLRQKALQAKKTEVKSITDLAAANNKTRADVLAAEAQQSKAEKAVLEATNGLSLAKQRLLVAVGRDPEGDITVTDTLSGGESTGSTAIDVESHPDMKRVRAAQEAARSAEAAAKAGRMPKVYFRGQIEDSTTEPGNDANNLAPDGYSYQLGLYVSIPIGQQWVGASGKLLEARARQEKYAEEAKALEGAIKLQVNHAHNKLSEAIKGLEVAQKQQEAAAEALKVTRQQAEAKNATKADVARAEDDEAGAAIGVLRALYDVKEAESALLREMGHTGI